MKTACHTHAIEWCFACFSAVQQPDVASAVSPTSSLWTLPSSSRSISAATNLFVWIFQCNYFRLATATSHASRWAWTTCIIGSRSENRPRVVIFYFFYFLFWKFGRRLMSVFKRMGHCARKWHRQGVDWPTPLSVAVLRGARGGHGPPFKILPPPIWTPTH